LPFRLKKPAISILDFGFWILDWNRTTPSAESGRHPPLPRRGAISILDFRFWILDCKNTLTSVRVSPLDTRFNKFVKNIHFFVYCIGKMGIKGCMLVGWTFGAKVPS
jgi:hypothetical protein